ncbi:MAG TPA: helix-turn-helix transcriptional regulator [Chthoniobacteraceae bacterium]|nr:helix-turn-helix transcriptional regulator [Chthoniobacteraceae bacterium]
MDGNVGKALRDARLAKKLTVEEAARATKIRAARLTDLENERYDHFPNLAYARGFLLIYARYLEVDLSKYQTIDIGNPARGGAYQYLKNTAESRTLRTFAPPKPVNRSRFLIISLLFTGAIAISAVTALVILTVLRLPLDQLIQEDQAALQAAAPTPAAASPTPEPTPTPPPLAEPEELISGIEEFMEADTLSLAAQNAGDQESAPEIDEAPGLWETPVAPETPEEALHMAAAAPEGEAEPSPSPTPEAAEEEAAIPRAIPVHTPGSRSSRRNR